MHRLGGWGVDSHCAGGTFGACSGVTPTRVSGVRTVCPIQGTRKHCQNFADVAVFEISELTSGRKGERSGGSHCFFTVADRCTVMFSLRILFRSVVRLRPSRSAAPSLPPIFPFTAFNAAIIVLRSLSR
jgi:hypothetical protein